MSLIEPFERVASKFAAFLFRVAGKLFFTFFFQTHANCYRSAFQSELHLFFDATFHSQLIYTLSDFEIKHYE